MNNFYNAKKRFSCLLTSSIFRGLLVLFAGVAGCKVTYAQTWNAVGGAGFSAAEAYSSIAIDASGIPYVVYQDNSNGQKATVMKYNGSTWVTVGSPGFSAGEAISTAIAIDGSGMPYVAYEDAGNSYKATVMKYNGSSWVTVGSAGFSAGQADFTSIAIDRSGTPYVVYQDGSTGSDKATVMKYNGSIWAAVGSAGFSAGAAASTSIAIDSSGSPYVVYEDVGNSSKATVMKYNGSSWVTLGSAGFSAGVAYITSIAIWGSTPYVVYEDGHNSNKATVMKYNGSAWAALGSPGFSAGAAVSVSIATDGSGTPYVAYEDAGNSYKTTVMKYNGSSWAGIGSAGFSAGPVQYVSIAIGEDGAPYVAYQDYANSNAATVMEFGTVLPDSITGITTVCAGAATTLSDAIAGGAWSSSNTSIATIGATTGIATGVAAGTTTITYTVSGATSTIAITVNPAVAPISGTATLCAGSSITFSDAASGGIWSSGHTSIATVGSGTGAVTGVDSGTVIISYTTTCSIPATYALTVNPAPNAGTITGANGLCVGGTITLSDAAPGGVWSASSATTTINSATGLVTGLAISGDNISYTVTNVYSCSAIATKHINAEGAPADIYTFSGTGTSGYTGDGGPAYLARLTTPRALATDASGNVYYCDVPLNVIRKISTTGIITTVAGNGTAGNTGDGGQATNATLNGPNGLYIDTAGNMLICNSNSSTIRKVNAATGIITTIAGTGVSGYNGDGIPATAAQLNVSLGVCEDASGNIYFTDQNNFRVRRIDAVTGLISTIIGYGSNYYDGDGGPGTAARIGYTRDIQADNSGNLYIVDPENNVIRKYVIATGIITTFAGTGGVGGSSGDGGPATAAKFNALARVAFDGGYMMYVADQGNQKVRQINMSTGIISTVAGTGTSGYTGDGGAAATAQLSQPSGIGCDHWGNLYIADALNHRIRLAATSGSMAITLSGPSSVPTGTPVTFTAYASIIYNASYQWQINGSNVGGATSSTYTDSSPLNGNVYTCVLTVNPECGSTFYDTSNSITLNVYGPPPMEPSGISASGISEGLRVYPNPVHGLLNISGTDLADGTAYITVYDELSRVVISKTSVVSNGKMDEKLDMESLPGGLYIISVTDNAGKIGLTKCIKN